MQPDTATLEQSQASGIAPLLGVENSNQMVPMAQTVEGAGPFPMEDLLGGDFDAVNDWKEAGGDINSPLVRPMIVRAATFFDTCFDHVHFVLCEHKEPSGSGLPLFGRH